MFWGLSIEGGKHYSQIVNETFNVTMAALETREFSGVDSKPTGLAQVMVRHDRTEFLLCSLQHGHLHQQPLNLCFSEGEEVTFFMEGKGMVHLSGYLRPSFSMDDGDLDYPSMSESDSEESLGNTSDDDGSMTLQELAEAKELLDSDEEDEEEADWMPPGKRKKKTKISKAGKTIEGPKRKKAKKTLQVAEEDYDEDEDEDYEYEGSDEDDEEESETDDIIAFEAEEASEDEELEDEEEKVQEKKAKQNKKMKKSGKAGSSNEKVKEKGSEMKHKKNKSTNGDNKENIEREALTEKNKLTPKQKVKQSPKSEKKTPKNQINSEESQPKKSAKKQKATPKKLQGGTTILDLKEGEGSVAKQGKKVIVYYRGVLASNQKQFDACMSGSGFLFRLGRGEVIKGWDVGVEGMKVGGKRKITVPPNHGYGSKRVGCIPANSTLIFEVELKSIK
ncbi:46 kDa FK506-binding nuclear protein-like isoform X14 [Anneissia japonica]|uniref:46 kDa FK506-binding nuclear protein-like isoform X14 n=1 Tax=Anneissia japonica TaxID=1529436 RepID=UPI001425896C|nr:46 kDa FK506-binding nuclear protein-like isoform X14 [Anneissia japonica]